MRKSVDLYFQWYSKFIFSFIVCLNSKTFKNLYFINLFSAMASSIGKKLAFSETILLHGVHILIVAVKDICRTYTKEVPQSLTNL